MLAIKQVQLPTLLQATAMLTSLATTTADDLKSFESSQELQAAVDAYLEDPSSNSTVAETYGWPMRVWQVHQVQDFSYLFDGARNPKADDFDEDLDCWDTGSATDMSYMFATSKFNGNVEFFDTSRVVKMQGMFEEASLFDRDLSCWDVSAVEDMSYMFSAAQSFRNGHIGSWCTQSVDDMGYMFYLAYRFNADVSRWDVSRVLDFRFMFSDASEFDQDLCSWSDGLADELRVERMRSMFELTSCPVETGPGTGSSMTMCHECESKLVAGGESRGKGGKRRGKGGRRMGKGGTHGKRMGKGGKHGKRGDSESSGSRKGKRGNRILDSLDSGNVGAAQEAKSLSRLEAGNCSIESSSDDEDHRRLERSCPVRSHHANERRKRGSCPANSGRRKSKRGESGSSSGKRKGKRGESGSTRGNRKGKRSESGSSRGKRKGKRGGSGKGGKR